MILKTIVTPKAIPRHMILTRWRFLPCFSSDCHDWLQILSIPSGHVFDVLLKRYWNILCAFRIEFWIRKLTMRFLINEYINSCVKVWSISGKYRALIGWPKCIKLYQGRGKQLDSKSKEVSPGSNLVHVKGKHVSKCIKLIGVLRMLLKNLLFAVFVSYACLSITNKMYFLERILLIEKL